MNRRGKTILPILMAMAATGDPMFFDRRKTKKPKVEIDTWHDDERLEKARLKRARKKAKRLKIQNR